MKVARRTFFPVLIISFVLTGALAVEASRPSVTTAEITAVAGCAPLDSLAIDLKDELVELMGRTDAMADTLLAIEGIARVPTTEISIVSDQTTCARAADAYGTYVSVSDPNRLVHAIRAGIRYLVMDPVYRNGPHKLGVTFDSSFTQKLASFNY